MNSKKIIFENNPLLEKIELQSRKRQGQRIKELRHKNGLSQTELGTRLKKSQAEISQLELGNRMFDIELVESVAQALKVSTEELFNF